MPAFKEHGEFVRPSDLVAGRKYLLKYKQDPDVQWIGVFVDKIDEGRFRPHGANEIAVRMKLLNHPIFKPENVVRFWPNEYEFYDLDELMEDV